MGDDYATFEKKRAARIGQVTRLFNAVQAFDSATQHVSFLTNYKSSLLVHHEKHEEIIDFMLASDEADEQKIDADIEKFSIVYCNALGAIEDKLDAIARANESAQPTTFSADFRAIELQFGEFQTFQEEYSAESTSVSNLRSRRDDLKPLHAQYQAAWLKVHGEADSTRQAALILNRKSFAEGFYDTIGWFDDEIALRAPPIITQSSSRTPTSDSTAKLPKLELLKYDGTPDTWVSFRDSFKSRVHNLTTVSGSTKFHYLKSSITDKNSPINHLLESDEGYDDAWKLVLEFYDDKRRIMDSHFNGILTAKRMTGESHEELQRLLNEYTLHISSLGRMKSDQELFNALVAHLVIFRLDTHTRDLWETENKSKIPLWPDLHKFLKERRKTLSTMPVPRAVQKPVASGNPKSSNNNKSWRTSSNHATVKTIVTNPVSSLTTQAAHSQIPSSRKCWMCSGEHRLNHCTQFLNATIPQRLEKVKEWKICTNCFGSHALEVCSSPFKCRSCQQKHHTMLHQESPAVQTHHLRATAPSFQVTSCNSMSAPGNSVALLQTAIIRIQDSFGEWHNARAFLDSGSESNYIVKNIAVALKLPMEKTHVVAKGLGGVQAAVIRQKLKANIGNGQEAYESPVEFLVTNKVTNPLPSAPVDPKTIHIPDNVILADPTFHVPGKIDILLGNAMYGKLLRNGRLELPSGPVLLNSMFGWLFTGSASIAKHSIASETHCHLTTLGELTQSLQRFYKLEDYRNDRRFFTEEETHSEEVFERTHERLPTGRFVTTTPFKENLDQLVNNHNSTLCQFLINEKRLQKNIPLREEYVKFMREYEELGHMTEVDMTKEPSNAPAYYFPHHGVEKPESTTTKLRVVYNGSSKTASGLSLNDTQCVGPQIQSDSFTLTLRFRQHFIVIKADIAKMYRQILVAPHQRRYQRIFWRDSPSDVLKIYELNTVTYGTASASFQSTRCLKQLAIDNKDKFPAAAHEVLTSFYVDDLISGAQTVPEAISLTNDIIKIVSSAEMNLRKFNSNNSEFLNSIPEEDREATKADMSIKALGIKWDPVTDKISFDVRPIEHVKITRRTVLSEVAKIYDPEGLLGPVTFRFKLFLKKVTQLSLPWDTELPESESAAWTEIARTFPELREIQIPRRFLISEPINIQIHGFCDASDLGYGAAIYLRSQDARGRRECHLVCAKSRIAPTEWKSTARLELCGAVVLAVLMTQVLKALTIPVDKKFCWTDSTTVLYWLKKLPTQLQTFVANRVSEIQELSTDFFWRHARGEQNPADKISRGLQPAEIINDTMWWHGPEFLLLPERQWPQSILEIEPNEPSYSCEFKKIESLVAHASDDTAAPKSFNPFVQWIEDSSCTNIVKRKLAPIMRFIFNSRCKKFKISRRFGPIQVDDMIDAEIALLRVHQQQHFREDFRRLSSGKSAASNSSLKNLNPQWDFSHKLIRVGGRLSNAEICAMEQKHPIIIPSCHFAKLIIRETHEQNMHAGQKATLGILRLRYWPIRAKQIIRHELHKCVKCFRARPKLTQQFMGSLPASRVTPALPFVHTGVDYCGPFDIKLAPTRNAKTTKSYVALFICLVTKAIHLEIVKDLTTKSFLNAFDRFTSCRGLALSINSDNGLNFVGANNMLQELYTFLAKSSTQSEIVNYFKQQETNWIFIPPRAPEHGGLWEAGVKSMKFHLHRVAETSNLTFEEFYTLIKKIEAILNSRPLTAISDDPNDVTFLTAGHFLIGRPLIAKADRNVTKTPINRLERWDRILQMQQNFWHQWSQDYLHQLQIRTKNYKEEVPVKVGQLVLLHIDNTPSMHWPIGRITKIFPGKDGITRVASIRTSKSTYERPVTKLAILPIDPADDQLLPREDVRA